MEKRTYLETYLDYYFSLIGKIKQKEEDIQADIRSAIHIKGDYIDKFVCPICHFQTYNPCAC